MTSERLSALTALHARCIQRARDHERAAARLREMEPERASLAADQAAEARAEASALADLLRESGADVLIPDPNQLALWADGYGGTL